MMIRKFRGETLNEALEEVRATFGTDAVVLQSRQGSGAWPRRGQSYVEVTAAPGGAGRLAAEGAGASGAGQRGRAGSSGTIRPFTPQRLTAAVPATVPNGSLDRSDADVHELETLRRLALQFEEKRSEPGLPAVVRSAPATQPQMGHEAAQLLHAPAVAVMGPSGGGKTTVAVSLAARAREMGRDVRLAVAGAYRPGAAAQARALARALHLEVEEATTPADLRALTQAATSLTVVDFAPAHPRVRADWADFTKAVGVLPTDAWRLLALPAGSCGPDTEDILDAFGGLGPLALVLTKCDETADPEACARLAAARSLAPAFRMVSAAVPRGLRPLARGPLPQEILR